VIEQGALDARILAEGLTDQWHNAPGDTVPLRVDLRLSEPEYAHYVESGALPDDFPRRHGFWWNP
jgi:hypothetical protein